MKRNGVTLIELLVVITIIAALLAILMPALGSAREAARLTHCMNNQRQLALGILVYADTNGQRFPSAYTVIPAHSWVPRTLPMIEEQAALNAMDLSVSWRHPNNWRAIQMAIPLLVCPSAPSDRSIEFAVEGGLKLGVSDYAPPGYVGLALWRLLELPEQMNRGGAMGEDERVSIHRVVDGLSRTLLLVEDAGRPQHWIDGRLGPEETRTGCENWNVIAGRVLGGAWADMTQVIPPHGFDDEGITCPGLNVAAKTNNNEAYSFHHGVVIASNADGSVRKLDDGIDARVYCDLVTRDGRMM